MIHLHLVEHDKFGATYRVKRSKEDGSSLAWLCNVTHDVFGGELLLKSSDIGSWLIGKQGGRWRVYVRENGEIRCVDNEILPDETKGTQ